MRQLLFHTHFFTFFMDRPMRPRAASTLMISASTMSPAWTTSVGWRKGCRLSWERWTSPGVLRPKSTSAEVDDVLDRAADDGADLQVRQGQDVAARRGFGKVAADVAAGLAQFFQDVFDRRLTGAREAASLGAAFIWILSRRMANFSGSLSSSWLRP